MNDTPTPSPHLVPNTVLCTIPSGGFISAATDCTSLLTIRYIGMPSGWSGGNLTFQYSPDGGFTFYDLFDSFGRQISMDINPGVIVPPPNGFPLTGNTFLKFRAGLRDFPVVQSADRIFTIVGG